MADPRDHLVAVTAPATKGTIPVFRGPMDVEGMPPGPEGTVPVRDNSAVFGYRWEAGPSEALADAKAYADEQVAPTELGTQHLDTVDAPGDYMQSENAEVQVESGYPVPYAGSLTVAANATGHIVIQQYRTYRASDNGKAWTRTRYLGNWSAWAESGGSALPTGGTTGQVLTKTSTGEAWSDGPLVGYLLTGPGRPDTPATTEGVITGAEPVGAEYRSTDGAGVGAFVWMKRPGGAWAVTDGDTGWRDLTELVSTEISVPMDKNTFIVKRSGNTITARANIAWVWADYPSPVIPGRTVLWTPSFGFRSEVGLIAGGRRSAGVIRQMISGQSLTGTSSSFLLQWDSGDARFRGIGFDRETTSGSGQIEWTTSDAWPTTLPGSPA